jgi:hypothetical protein
VAVGSFRVIVSCESIDLTACRRHAFSDLMAYSSTFEFCDQSPFASLTAWATHEKTEHMRDWRCPIYNNSCDSRSLLMAHVSKSHPSSGETMSCGQVNDASPPVETATVAQCPFCDEPVPWGILSGIPTTRGSDSIRKSVRIDWYQQHLSHHMEQLALLAKSASVGADKAGDDSDAGGSSPAVSSDTTEQSDDPAIVTSMPSDSFGVEPLAADSVRSLASDRRPDAAGKPVYLIDDHGKPQLLASAPVYLIDDHGESHLLSALFHTGANRNLISKAKLSRLRLEAATKKLQPEQIDWANGSIIVTHVVKVNWRLASETASNTHIFYVVPGLEHEIVIGQKSFSIGGSCRPMSGGKGVQILRLLPMRLQINTSVPCTSSSGWSNTTK